MLSHSPAQGLQCHQAFITFQEAVETVALAERGSRAQRLEKRKPLAMTSEEKIVTITPNSETPSSQDSKLQWDCGSEARRG